MKSNCPDEIFIFLTRVEAKIITLSLNSNNILEYNSYFSINLPLNWYTEDSTFLFDMLINNIIEKLKINPKTKFNIYTYPIKAKFNNTLNLNVILKFVEENDFLLVPYILSSCLDIHNLGILTVDQYLVKYIDNQNNDFSFRWNDWQDIITTLNKELSNLTKSLLNESFINNLIRPVLKSSSFDQSLSILAMISLSRCSINTKGAEVSLILSGELLASLESSQDLLFTSINLNKKSSLCHIYCDTINILPLITIFKNISLSLAEIVAGISVRHIADIVYIKSKRNFNKKDIIGRINIKDDNGFRSFYPFYNDILVLDIEGIAEVSIDLEEPFFIDLDKNFRSRDKLVIDTRPLSSKKIFSYEDIYNKLKYI